MADLRHEEYLKNGYISYPGLLGSSELKCLVDEIQRISAGSTLASHNRSRLEMEPKQEPGGTLVRRIYEPCSHYAPFREISDSPKLLDSLETLLGADLIFQYSKINMKPPAIGSVVEWHQDITYYPLTNDSALAVLIYLDNADVENGCLQVIPGGHKGKILDHNQNGYFVGKIVDRVDESKAVPLEGEAGTAIFMHCMTPRTSVTSRSNRPRRTLILGYRSADSFPVYTGDITDELESCSRLVRG